MYVQSIGYWMRMRRQQQHGKSKILLLPQDGQTTEWSVDRKGDRNWKTQSLFMSCVADV
jgi:hypothetical protein